MIVMYHVQTYDQFQKLTKNVSDTLNESTVRDKYDLEKEFNDLNRELFGGKLKPVPLKWVNNRNSMGLVRTTEPTNGEVKIDYLAMSSFYNIDRTQFRNTLAHEMIHVFLAQQNIRERSHHGPEFMKLANKFNKKGFNITIKEEDVLTPAEDKRRELIVIVRTKITVQNGVKNEKKSFAVLRLIPTETIIKDLQLVYDPKWSTWLVKKVPKNPTKITNHFSIWKTSAKEFQSFTLSRKVETLGWYEMKPDLMNIINEQGVSMGEITV